MTSPSLTSQPISSPANGPSVATSPARTPVRTRIVLPVVLFCVTLFTTTAVGMRYMENFRLGHAPLATDADILPYDWVFHHLSQLATGFPFSLTLITILLAHEFGHYFACRTFHVQSTLPYLLPAPSISGSFGAIIRLKSRVPSRTALLFIAAMGPIAGFLVAMVAVVVGLHASTYVAVPVIHRVQAPLIIALAHAFSHSAAQPLELLLPHPILSAAWLGILITALNLIPAGQLDGGHIAYAISPEVHRVTSRSATVVLLLLGIFSWIGWMLWAIILLTPGMRHPKVPTQQAVKPWHFSLVPACVAILILAATYQPFQGYSLLHVLHLLPHLSQRYR